MPVTREGPDLHGLVTVLSTHSVPAKPLTHGQPGGWEWRSSKEHVASSAASILIRIFTSQRSSTNRIGSLERDPSPRPGRAIAKCSPGCAPSESCNASESSSTGSYGAGLLRFMQQAKVTVLEVTTPGQAGSASAWQERRSRRAERRPCRLCRPADRDAAKPGRHDRIPAGSHGLPEDGGERQAYRPADDPQHDRLRP